MFYVVVSIAKSDVSALCSGLCCQFCVVVAVTKSDVSVLCFGFDCQVRCKCSVLWPWLLSQLLEFYVVVSIYKSHERGFGCQFKCFLNQS